MVYSIRGKSILIDKEDFIKCLKGTVFHLSGRCYEIMVPLWIDSNFGGG